MFSVRGAKRCVSWSFVFAFSRRRRGDEDAVLGCRVVLLRIDNISEVSRLNGAPFLPDQERILLVGWCGVG